MTLVDLRRFAIRRQSSIRFTLRNGMECVISEDGIARVPALKGVPDFNLEQELAAATAFVVEAAVPAGAKNPPKPKPTPVGRPELTAMALDSPPPPRRTTSTTTSKPASCLRAPCVLAHGELARRPFTPINTSPPSTPQGYPLAAAESLYND